MGFFSSILGGSKSSSKAGFGALPKNIRGQFSPFASQIEQYTNPANAGVTQSFTPMPQTPDETQAFSLMRQGFAPTPQSIQSDMAMQMNPFNASVIDEINRQGGGQYSLLKQAMNEAGQVNSNRQLLGANDIDLSRMNQIGGFLQNQFNTSMGNALNVMPQMRAQDASGLLNIGDFMRQLQMQTQQAPVNALGAGMNLINPWLGGSTSSTKGGGGIGGLLQGAGAIGQGISAIGSMFSDRRLKENIKHIGNKNGHNLYKFNYKGNNKKYIGVMADEVKKIDPDAVIEVDNYMMVNYSKIGIDLEESN